jgi:uncharacterized protein YdeI (YjbR/CyaY-like superfamily)
MPKSKISSKPTEKTPESKVPTDLRKALAAAPLVEAVWKGLTPMARADFIIWINAARQPETRKNRIERTCSMLTAGKRRPCCFTIVPTKLYKALEANPKAKAQWKNLNSTARRDFVIWIDSAKDRDKNTARIQQACALLVASKEHP